MDRTARACGARHAARVMRMCTVRRAACGTRACMRRPTSHSAASPETTANAPTPMPRKTGTWAWDHRETRSRIGRQAGLHVDTAHQTTHQAFCNRLVIDAGLIIGGLGGVAKLGANRVVLVALKHRDFCAGVIGQRVRQVRRRRSPWLGREHAQSAGGATKGRARNQV